SNLTATSLGGAVSLNWNASPDPVPGYHVYRAPYPTGPFSRLTSSLVSQTAFSDLNVSPGTYSYMVRAVTLQTTPSGTYFNSSQGILADATVPPLPPPMTLLANRAANSIQLTWNSQPGSSYHVQFKSSHAQDGWTDLSGTIIAAGSTTSWSDPAPMSDSQK